MKLLCLNLLNIKPLPPAQLLPPRHLGKTLLGSVQGQGLGNELSAPYEVPQFPIEQIETKLLR